MNVRGMIVAASVWTIVGCATAQAAGTPGVRGKEEEYQFSGYTLKVQLDDGGMLVGAKAFDKDRKEVPTVVVPAREVTVCVPKAAGAAQGAGQQCEPFLYMPEKTFFKTGTGSTCQLWYQGRLIYYQCP